MVTVKDTTKRDFKIKGASIVNGEFYDESEKKNLVELLTKTFGENAFFDISATLKTDEDIDVESVL